jgi:hypothetical protein
MKQKMDAGVTTEWRNRYQLLNDLEDVMARIHWGIEVLFELSALADQKIETGAVAWAGGAVVQAARDSLRTLRRGTEMKRSPRCYWR